jgi:hypothetical protein
MFPQAELGSKQPTVYVVHSSIVRQSRTTLVLELREQIERQSLYRYVPSVTRRCVRVLAHTLKHSHHMKR